MATEYEGISAWRNQREPGWFRDVGYALQDVLRVHQYDYKRKGDKPDDPGWHECTCGWGGYWCDFEPHVTDHLRLVVERYRDRVLEKLSADGRLITGEVEKQYGRRDFEDGLVVGPLPDKPQPTRFFEPVFRFVSGWLPVSDIGNDPDNQESSNG